MKDLEDIKKFGEEIGLKESKEGEIDSPYALLIEGIDRPEDQELVYQVLSTSEVDLDLDSLRKQLNQGGHALVSHLNEAKAAMIVDKIKDIEAANIRFGPLDELRPKKSHPERSEGSQSEEPFFVKGEVVLTTAPSIPEKSVRKYLGIVSTEITMPEEVVMKELHQEKEDVRSEYDLLVSKVLKALEAKAKKMHANAVIAVTFDFKFLPEQKSFVIFATGTAVEI
ncbi:MAG: hypothetical protein A2Z91_02370 [Deltaproteobacteria bacterium GWA2_38_16]|nr:MAG: hypothetical protein A2Z91_02370 [Deltaproteobacteria bacterium GWA2_38_16]OGQ02040.1 MAG: hypothetical protein A3D19_08665 [Deltaproteobacteria bacterium RIFCSPHIGHO2_02_FULL_38_15]OGQ33303.1 MAG: hypothetical protein A3A72_07250 [Deltaproteobacteria bacterium RIFCSPLOWO2_01_FULL_38_9]HBQ21575.1 hypothetical protein [Deltaproteobacteria bacterium]